MVIKNIMNAPWACENGYNINLYYKQQCCSFSYLRSICYKFYCHFYLIFVVFFFICCIRSVLLIDIYAVNRTYYLYNIIIY